MEQEKALNALAMPLALSAGAQSPRVLADLIERATSSQGTYIFSELLYSAKVQSLSSSPEYAPHLRLLQLFAHGTYADYLSAPTDANLPTLNDAQTRKLRQLSVLSLASDRSNLSYGTLQTALGLNSTREVEDIVISAIYAGLLHATLDPARQVVAVSSVAPLRDLAPGMIPELIAGLKQWGARCDETLSELEAQTQLIRTQAAEKAKEKSRAEATIAKLVEAEKEGSLAGGIATRKTKRGQTGGGGMHGTGDDEEAMDLDTEDGSEDKKRGASRRKL